VNPEAMVPPDHPLRQLIEAWARLAQGSAKRSLMEWPDEGSMKSFRPKDGRGKPPGSGQQRRA
jgi:hypothetical protein